MTEKAKPRPLAGAADKEAAGRQERLAAALRANLARRKAQQRERDAQEPPAQRPKPRG